MSKKHFEAPRPLLLVSLLTSAFAVHPQTSNPPQVVTEGANQFIGDKIRIGAGVSDESKAYGEIGGVFMDSDTQAWHAEGWTSDSAGGAKISLHKLGNNLVHKYFLAHDQNKLRQKKLTLGYGLENPSWHGSVYVSRGNRAQSLISTQTTSQTSEQNGVEGNSPYLDTTVNTSVTRIFEQAINHGVGMRVGHYAESLAVRTSVGLDHEWGDAGARLNTVSAVAEKFFPGTPHSIALQLSRSNFSSHLEDQRHINRAVLMYRFSFGGSNSQPERSYKVTAKPAPVVQTSTTVTTKEKQWVKTRVTMNSDALFDFDSYKLNSAAKAELDRIAQILKAQGRDGRIKITGHTCDLGTDKINDRMSLRRAQAVLDHLVQGGTIAQDDAVLVGMGKRQPKYAATAATRAQNRRVEIEFFSYENKEEWIEKQTVVPAASPNPAVVYEREAISTPPAWIQRALRSSANHKRTVDNYRIQQKTETSITTRQWLPNDAPIARSDFFWVSGRTPSTLDVLTNDSDPDGDSLKLLSVSAPLANTGTVSVSGQSVLFTPFKPFYRDTFSYTVGDGRGGSATTTVELIDP